MGRKRHLLVDTLGLVVAAVVHPANEPDADGGRLVLERARERTPRVEKLWADAAYRGAFVAWAEQNLGWHVEIVGRAKGSVGFAVQPRRWVVERTFAWLGRYRRLSKDYEEQPETGEAWIAAAMTHILVRRLAPGQHTLGLWAAPARSRGAEGPAAPAPRLSCLSRPAPTRP
jgi:putative transposase